MKNLKKISALGLVVVLSMTLLIGCSDITTTDSQQAKQTADIQVQSASKLGMPNIKNFYEKETLKNIMEQCDNSNLITYTYIKNDMTGKFTFLGQSMGYGVPYSTEYTNPEYATNSGSTSNIALPQPDPNGLYKSQNTSATWVMLIDPTSKTAKPVYVESNITVSQFKLPKVLCDISTLPSDY